jgi:hypothetical protein
VKPNGPTIAVLMLVVLMGFWIKNRTSVSGVMAGTMLVSATAITPPGLNVITKLVLEAVTALVSGEAVITVVEPGD